MISPLRTHNEVIGYIFAVRKNELIFYKDDKKAVDTFSDYASVAIQNSFLLNESIEKERLEKELDVARDMQKKILPSKDPVLDKLEISSVFIPAFEVGGDYYDYFQIDNNKLGFVIADVSGKGISAAFIMAEIKGIFETLSKLMSSPREILIKANQILQNNIAKKNFISALYGVIDIEKEELHIARAGHCPALIVRDGQVIEFKPGGIGLGLSFKENFSATMEEQTIKLVANDTIVLYTDGITEAKNDKFEDFGDKRFSDILIKHSQKSSDEIANQIMQQVTLFSSNHSQYDDVTLMIIKWKSSNNLNGVNEWQNSVHQLKNSVT